MKKNDLQTCRLTIDLTDGPAPKKMSTTTLVPYSQKSTKHVAACRKANPFTRIRCLYRKMPVKRNHRQQRERESSPFEKTHFVSRKKGIRNFQLSMKIFEHLHICILSVLPCQCKKQQVVLHSMCQI